ILCVEIKNRIQDFQLPDPEMQPSKSDVEQITGLLNDLRENFDRLKDTHEADIDVQAQCFDDRKREAEEIITLIGCVKIYLDEMKSDMKTKLEEGSADVGKLADNVRSLDETIGSNFGLSA